jgi:hypothetical protein
MVPALESDDDEFLEFDRKRLQGMFFKITLAIYILNTYLFLFNFIAKRAQEKADAATFWAPVSSPPPGMISFFIKIKNDFLTSCSFIRRPKSCGCATRASLPGGGSLGGVPF